MVHGVKHLPLRLAHSTNTALLGSSGSLAATVVDMPMRYKLALAKQVDLGILVAVRTITGVELGMVATGVRFAAVRFVDR